MNVQEKLHREGFRLTHPRRLVLSILREAKIPLSPQTIHQCALERNEEIGLASVYRALALLGDLGFVRRVHDHEECQGYVLASPGHHHHLICRYCGKAVEFSGADDLSSFMDRIEEQTGFSIEEHLLQFYGLCPECQRKNKNDKKKKI